MNANKVGYRGRAYSNYATKFMHSGIDFDRTAAKRWAKGYDHYLRRWLPKERDAAIADVACGGGRLLHFFRERGYANIQGVDISPEQVQLARQVTPNVAQADVLQFLQSCQASFDLITGLDIIEHFSKDEALAFVDSCYQALKPGGRVVIQTPNSDTPWAAYYRYGDITHEIAFHAKSLANILQLCGFIQVEPREMGPVPWGYSVASSVRFVIWQVIRMQLKVWNIVETGNVGTGVYSRVFLISAVRP